MNKLMKQWMELQNLIMVVMVIISTILTGCTTDNYAPVSTPIVAKYIPGEYYVQPGDTLFSIAWAYGLDYRTLEKINGIQPGAQIQPGQYLRVNPHAAYISSPYISSQAKPQVTTNTQISKTHAVSSSVPRPLPKIKTIKTPQSVKMRTEKLPPVSRWIWPAQGKVITQFAPAQGDKGIDISGTQGAPIRAAAAGIVVYAGTGLSAYGKLIILKNNENYLSAYAHNHNILVKEGEKVQQGQIIATMGHSGTTKTMLHFEIRKNGQPVNPMLYLK